jgi:hypothetical protein
MIKKWLMAAVQELATKRVTTLMTAREKSKLEAKARRAGMSVGDFVRRSVESYDPEEAAELAELAALSAELERSNRKAAAALDRALESLAATRSQRMGSSSGAPVAAAILSIQ